MVQTAGHLENNSDLLHTFEPVHLLVSLNIHSCYLSTLFKASYYFVVNIHFISKGFFMIKIMGKSK